MALFEHFPYTNFQDLNLDTLLTKMRELLAAMKSLQDLIGGYEDRIEALETYINNMDQGNFSEAFLNSLYTWLNDNVPEILANAIKMVWFGLTDTGYFVAYIPESWNDIQFNTTGWDYETPLQPEYGHLVLSSRGGV